jgi:hypothetical protein
MRMWGVTPFRSCGQRYTAAIKRCTAPAENCTGSVEDCTAGMADWLRVMGDCAALEEHRPAVATRCTARAGRRGFHQTRHQPEKPNRGRAGPKQEDRVVRGCRSQRRRRDIVVVQTSPDVPNAHSGAASQRDFAPDGACALEKIGIKRKIRITSEALRVLNLTRAHNLIPHQVYWFGA